jgi:hypothetical protein
MKEKENKYSLNRNILLYQKKYIIKFINTKFMPLNPFFKISDKLLVPLIFSDYLLKDIQLNKFIYSRVPNYSLVKLFLNLELEQTIKIANQNAYKRKN